MQESPAQGSDAPSKSGEDESRRSRRVRWVNRQRGERSGGRGRGAVRSVRCACAASLDRYARASSVQAGASDASDTATPAPRSSSAALSVQRIWTPRSPRSWTTSPLLSPARVTNAFTTLIRVFAPTPSTSSAPLLISHPIQRSGTYAGASVSASILWNVLKQLQFQHFDSHHDTDTRVIKY